ncbi:MAG: DNA polymerase III subunit gamma/tau [Abditibacteriota bacterium]|nr:DNA polymerase III subunit gamma/tau [Abditibacteriota bacterium]
MGYLSLFRKYRSESFNDLVGQDHIVRTISNFIASGKIPQGYLFCGTRGTGKTTVARIIAKALNCEHGPTPEPCCKCHACTSIRDGSAVDVYEMDAASNRGVDDVEAIVESVRYRPSEFRYKVYIIDEAHQLSNQAKDAFLKTLEEPPSYAVFILATTEAHKIPVTIRSRCQQFDFRRGTPEAIGSRVAYVAECENVSISPGAVMLIARAAAGSYRDSLSILEQVISFAGNEITEKDVTNVLGMVEEDILFDISRAVLEKDMAKAFSCSDSLLSGGKDIRDAIPCIAGFFRDLMAVKIGADKNRSEKWFETASRFSESRIAGIVDTFLSAEKTLRYTSDARLAFELAFMKACAPEETVQTAAPAVTARPAQEADKKPEKEPVRILQKEKPAGKVRDTRPSIDINNLRTFWKRLLEYVRVQYKKVQLVKAAANAELREYSDGILYIRFPHTDGYSCNLCREEQKTLEQALEDCYHFHISLQFDIEPAKETAPETHKQETVAPPVPEGLTGEKEEGPKETAESRENEPEADSYTNDNPFIKEEPANEDNLLEDPRYEDHPMLEKVRDIFKGSTVETIDK